jgi:hypothetical protein
VVGVLLLALLTPSALSKQAVPWSTVSLAAKPAGRPGAVTAHQLPFSGRVGLSSHLVDLPDPQNRRYMSRAVRAGFTWFREDFSWSVIQPTRDRFDWKQTDTLMANASRLGANILPIVTYAPDWANGQSGDNKYPPSDPSDFARFVHRVLDRYASGGTFWRRHPRLAPVPITRIEIWNEPWHWQFWKPNPDPSSYNRLVRATAEALRRDHPSVMIIASADWNQSTSDGSRAGAWFPAVLADDRSLYTGKLVGGYSVHLYSQSRPPSDSRGRQEWRYDRVLLSVAAAKASKALKPFFNTEFGWKTPDDVAERDQARYLVDAVRIAVEDWGDVVQQSYVYTYQDPQSARGTHEYNLLRANGSTREAWSALSELILEGPG